ncbi:MAG: hypothetical protein AAGI51_05160, partial [Pseudomonadota bacterium]
MRRLARRGLAVGLALALGAAAAQEAAAQTRVALEAGSGYVVPRAILGANMIYTVETDRVRRMAADGAPAASEAEGALMRAARGAGLGYLRFPGGTAAQNFNWITNGPLASHEDALSRGLVLTPRNLWRFSGERRLDALMDTVEFVRFARAAGAEPALIVNLEGPFHSPEAPIEGLAGRGATGLTCEMPRDPVGCYVKLAAEWVHEINVVRGLRVRDWDLGNESFGIGNRHSFTAREYAALVPRFSRAMKAVDPSIRIGVIGPWEARGHAFADRLTPEGRARFRALTHQARRTLLRDGRRRGLNLRGIARELNGGRDVGEPARWWPVLLSEAAGHYDYAALHRLSDYGRSLGPNAHDLSRPVTIGDALDAFARMSSRATGAPVPVSLNAWSTIPANAGNEDRLDALGAYLTTLELLGQIAEARVDSAAVWPFSHAVSKGLVRLRGSPGQGFRASSGLMRPPYEDFS